jgi:AcrR family transcriptional regulator
MDRIALHEMVGLRERKKLQTRAAIQREALRLFLAKGYDATTVEEIAAAAGVSHMTFFRYFPTKEDVVMSDDYDPLIFDLVAARPAGETVFDSVRVALRAGLERIYAEARDALFVRTRLILHTPQLRARLWEQQAATEGLIARALAGRAGMEVADLRTRVLAAASVSALTTALRVWVERDGADEFPALVDQAFDALVGGSGIGDG